MSIRPSEMTNPTACSICGSRELHRVAELPKLPLTGLFSTRPDSGPIERFDQALLVCGRCGHGQLESQLDPTALYDHEYSFRTSVSATARAGTEHFVVFLDRVAPGRTFKCALDLGCNDLHLLDLIRGRAALRVGVDPIWRGREEEAADKSVFVIGSTFEEADLRNRLIEKPDLILCRHTLEHIREPLVVVEQVFELAADGAVLIFEAPGFDALVRRSRFDQVFHQHLQYFNLGSFQTLGQRVGAKYLASCENYHEWGALLVAFKKSSTPAASDIVQSRFTPSEIHSRHAAFKDDMVRTGELLLGLADWGDGEVFGYGAAQMLPVLAYNMQTDLSMLQAVLDDDPAKQGLYYKNLSLRIMSPVVVKRMQETSVFITAPDNVKPIMVNLLSGSRPRHILCPLHVI